MEDRGIIKRSRCECKRCGHRWRPRIESPHFCPRCRSLLWYKTDVEIGPDRRVKVRFTETGRVGVGGAV